MLDTPSGVCAPKTSSLPRAFHHPACSSISKNRVANSYLMNEKRSEGGGCHRATSEVASSKKLVRFYDHVPLF